MKRTQIRKRRRRLMVTLMALAALSVTPAAQALDPNALDGWARAALSLEAEPTVPVSLDGWAMGAVEPELAEPVALDGWAMGAMASSPHRVAELETVALGAPAGTDLRLHSPAGTGITFIDAGEPGESVGDYLIFRHGISNEAGRRAGALRGLCTFVATTLCEGDVTFDLKRGLITVEGPFRVEESTNRFAITGGTGPYSGASGVLTVRSSEERNDFTFRFDHV